MYEHGFLAPVVALIVWSLAVLIWLYATRIPAMNAAGIKPGTANREDMARMPAWAVNVADNYNHLMEQPTIFYAVCFALQLLGRTEPALIGWAWTYVALRVLHSLVQNLGNVIIVRFAVFVLASIALSVLTFHAAAAVGMFAWR